MTTQERLRQVADDLRKGRKPDVGLSVPELLLLAADEMDEWIGLLASTGREQEDER